MFTHVLRRPMDRLFTAPVLSLDSRESGVPETERDTVRHRKGRPTTLD